MHRYRAAVQHDHVRGSRTVAVLVAHTRAPLQCEHQRTIAVQVAHWDEDELTEVFDRTHRIAFKRFMRALMLQRTLPVALQELDSEHRQRFSA